MFVSYLFFLLCVSTIDFRNAPIISVRDLPVTLAQVVAFSESSGDKVTHTGTNSGVSGGGVV